MVKEFTVYTDRSNVNESLAQSVMIAFALTPSESRLKRPGSAFPIAHVVMDFHPNDEQTQSFKLGSDLGFSLAARKTEHSISVEKGYCRVPPTHFVELKELPTHKQPRWSRNVPFIHEISQQERLVVAANKTNGNQLIALGCIRHTFDTIGLGFQSFDPIACFYIPPGSSAFAPSSLLLQAYVVKDMKLERNQLLDDNNLKNPIFDEPIRCDSLQPNSKWRLYRDHTGAIKLQNQETQGFDLQAAQDHISEIKEALNDTKAGVSRLDSRVLTLEVSSSLVISGPFGGMGQGGLDTPPMSRAGSATGFQRGEPSPRTSPTELHPNGSFPYVTSPIAQHNNIYPRNTQRSNSFSRGSQRNGSHPPPTLLVPPPDTRSARRFF